MDIQINYDYRKDELEKLPLHELAQFVLAREDKPFNTEVSVSFVTDEAIAELNERYRHKEGPTDVLSFECDGVNDDLSAMTLAEDPVYELGDVICLSDEKRSYYCFPKDRSIAVAKARIATEELYKRAKAAQGTQKETAAAK